MNNDNVCNVLNELPEKWIGTEMNLHAIADRKDAHLDHKQDISRRRERFTKCTIQSRGI